MISGTVAGGGMVAGGGAVGGGGVVVAGGGGACGGAEVMCCEAEGAVKSCQWQYVGQGCGKYEQAMNYNYVGEGCGSYDQTEVVTYYGWKVKPICMGVGVIGIFAAVIVVFMQPTVTTSTTLP